MTAKDYLNRAYRINELIGEHMQELAKLHQMKESLPSGGGGGNSHSAGNASYAKIVERIVDFENEIRQKNAEMLDMRIEVRKRIDNVENVYYNLILKKRYLQFMTMEDIAKDLGFCERHIKRLHKKALSVFEQVNKDVIECHSEPAL